MISYRADFLLEPGQLSFYVLSSDGTRWYSVVVFGPKGKKAAGRSPLRRFRASCECKAGCRRGGIGIKCCHVGLVFGTFFC